MYSNALKHQPKVSCTHARKKFIDYTFMICLMPCNVCCGTVNRINRKFIVAIFVPFSFFSFSKEAFNSWHLLIAGFHSSLLSNIVHCTCTLFVIFSHLYYHFERPFACCSFSFLFPLSEQNRCFWLASNLDLEVSLQVWSIWGTYHHLFGGCRFNPTHKAIAKVLSSFGNEQKMPASAN